MKVTEKSKAMKMLQWSHYMEMESPPLLIQVICA